MYARILPFLIASSLIVACGDDYDDPGRPGGDDLRNAPGAERLPVEPPAYGGVDGKRDGDFDDRKGVPVNDDRDTPDNDNTAMNKQDKDGDTVTPMDQGQSASDVKITADIRKAVLGAENLSTNADNVKIITNGGIVTLRGVVNSQEEKAAVEGFAKAAQGVTRVDNQLELNIQ